MLKKFFGLISSDLAIDLGTANILVYQPGKGIIINEPSVVAVKTDDANQQKVLAVGLEAKEMVGRTPDHIKTIRPIKDGVIADFATTEAMLKYFINKARNKNSLFRPRIIICIPSGVTDVERRAVEESALSAGARDVYLVEEPIAAAVGANMPIKEAAGSMVVDIGGGTTEVAIISLSGIVFAKSVRVAGDKMDEAIIQHIKRKYSILIGDRTAEKIKIQLAEAAPSDEDRYMEIKGRDLVRGIPRTIKISSSEIRETLMEPIRAIVDAIKLALERTPPELASDIYDNGIMLTGGGAMLKNLDILISNETGLPVHLAEEPLCCVVLGSGRILEEFNDLKELLIQYRKSL